jgi:hypothetical protein
VSFVVDESGTSLEPLDLGSDWPISFSFLRQTYTKMP